MIVGMNLDVIENKRHIISYYFLLLHNTAIIIASTQIAAFVAIICQSACGS